MIDRVHFENFKSLANVTIDLGRFTVLVGANGCGKTSLLQGIDLLSRALIGDPARLATDPLQPLRVVARHGDGDELTVQVEVGPKSRTHLSLDGPGGSRAISWLSAEQEIGAALSAQETRFAKFYRVMYLHLDAVQLSRSVVSEQEVPRMDADGSGLASTLAWMKGAAEDDLASITADLARIVPGVKRIRTLRERVKQRRMEKLDIDGQPVWRPIDESKLGDRFEIEFDDGASIPADLLSEGTVLALGLLTKLREPNRPRLVLLDDIDRGLHLEAQARLVQILRELMQIDPELQIVCTTHSPYLLDLFDPADVRVLALDAQRHTHARPLTEHPDFGKWKFGTQTGELWAALGEAWVTGAGAGA